MARLYVSNGEMYHREKLSGKGFANTMENPEAIGELTKAAFRHE